MGFLRDCMLPGAKIPLNVNEPLYIIELGTGSGKFSYYMLKALEEMKDVCSFPFKKIVYVMTDFTETNFNFWSTHHALKVNQYCCMQCNMSLYYILYSEVFRLGQPGGRHFRCCERRQDHTALWKGSQR